MSSLLDETFGALLLSTFISLLFYGLTLAQTMQYFRLYPSDRPFLKTLVAAIVISDTLHSASMIHICYHYFAPAELFVDVWTVDLLPLSMGITVLLAQGFYTRRIYVVNGASYKHRLLVFFVVLLLSIEFGFMIASSIASFRSSRFGVLRHYSWMNAIAFAIAAVVDLVLTGAFVTIMRRCRTGFLGTDTALDLLARYAVVATALVSALAIPAFVCSLVLWNGFVYTAITVPVAKVYANSVLAVLNCRKSLPRPGNVTDDSEAGCIRLNALGPGYGRTGSRPTQTERERRRYLHRRTSWLTLVWRASVGDLMGYGGQPEREEDWELTQACSELGWERGA